MTLDGETDAEERRRLEVSAGPRLALIVDSYRRMTGRALPLGAEGDLWTAAAGVVAHGTEDDPIFFYGNRRALALFELTAEQLLAMPSRLSAEPGEREERARLMARVARDGFIDDYAGVRISRGGRRFRIEQATVWNLVDAEGVLHGQAAAFPRWTRLD
jgi:hypothetical protein